MAVVDTGVNPYHPVFSRSETVDTSEFTDALTGAPPRTIDLADAGDYWARVSEDADDWNGILAGELVRFADTNLLAVSIDAPSGDRACDINGYGTATAGLLATTWPDATIVMVQVNNGGFLGEAIEWAAAQP